MSSSAHHSETAHDHHDTHDAAHDTPASSNLATPFIKAMLGIGITAEQILEAVHAETGARPSTKSAHSKTETHAQPKGPPPLSDIQKEALRAGMKKLGEFAQWIQDKSGDLVRQKFTAITGSSNFKLDPKNYEPKHGDVEHLIDAFTHVEKLFGKTPFGQQAKAAGEALFAHCK